MGIIDSSAARGHKLAGMLAFFLFFFFIFAPRIAVAGYPIPLAHLTATLVVVAALVKKPSALIWPDIFFAALLAATVSVYGAFVEAVSFGYPSDKEAYAFSRMSIRNFVYYIFGLGFFALFPRYKQIGNLLKVFFIAAVVNSMVVIVEYVVPGVRTAIESVMFQNPSSNIDYLNVDWRLRGLAAQGGASLALASALGIWVGLYSERKRLISMPAAMAGSLIILLSTIVVARTGLLLGLGFFALWICMVTKSLDRKSVALVALLPVVAAGAVVLVVTIFSEVIPWAFELFINVAAGRGLTTGSTSELLSMLKVPDDALRVIFGFGFFEADVSFRSDSGYIKTMYSVGILGSTLIYGLHAYFLLYRLPRVFSNYAGFFYVSGLVLFFAEIKEPFLYQNYTARFLIILYALSFCALRGGHCRKLFMTRRGCAS